MSLKSTGQIRFKSTPKHVTMVKGAKIIGTPMASGRVTPTAKTTVKIYPNTYHQ